MMLAETACRVRKREHMQAFSTTTNAVRKITMIQSFGGDCQQLDFWTDNLRRALTEHLKRLAFRFGKDEQMVSLIRVRFRTQNGVLVETNFNLGRVDLAMQLVATDEDGFKVARITLAEYGSDGAFGLKFLQENKFAMDMHPKAGSVYGPAVYSRIKIVGDQVHIVSTGVGVLTAPSCDM